MLQTFKTVIGPHTYTVTQLDAVTGRKVLARIVRNIGPAIAKAQSTAKDGEAAQGAAFIGEVVGALTDENIEYLCDTFAAVTKVSGGNFGDKAPWLSNVFGAHFAGRYTDMAQWLKFCVEENFAGFFADARSLLKGKEQPTTAASESSSATA